MTEYQKMPVKTRMFDACRNIFKLPFLEKFLIKVGAGKKVNSFAYRLIPRIYSYAPGTWRTIERDGIKMKLDISNYVDHSVYFCIGDPGFERLKRMIEPSWVVMDVGANIGATVLVFSRLANMGKIFGFEPNKKSFTRLRENISLNPRYNITTHNVGLGEREEQVQLFVIDETNPGMNRILNESVAETKKLKSETVQIKRLDDFIVLENLQQVDVVKIDVEGFEHKVLNGAIKILTSFRPVLFIEINNDNISQNGSSAKELVTMLMQLGYQIFIAEPWMRIDDTYNFDHCHFDILCIHSNRVADIKLYH